jgi:hypothetical protein
MRRSDVRVAANLRELLLRFPELVDGLRSKDPGLPGRLEEWLKEGEEVLKASGMPECARLAGLRSRLLAPIHDPTRRQDTSRKRRYEVAAAILFDVQAALLAVYSPIEERLKSCKDVLRQLLAAVAQAGVARYHPEAGFESLVDELWTLLTSHEQLKPGMAKVTSIVSRVDARLLLAEAIDLEAWSG